MFQVEVDESKNLLTVRFWQHVGPDDAKAVFQQAATLLPRLPPGFRLLTDLSGLESMEMACVPDIRGMMDACNKQGVDMIVRVVPDPRKDIGLNILSLFHYRRRVQIVTCATLEEALKVLAG